MRRYLPLLFIFCVLAPTTTALSVSLDVLPPCNFVDGANIEGLMVGAVVLNIETGTGCADSLDYTFPVASVPKLFIAGAYLEQVAAQTSSFNTPITFNETYLMDLRENCPTQLSDADVGKTFTLGYLSEIMISCSDNSATWMLMDNVGASRVQDYINRLGIVGIGPVIPYSEVDRIKLSLIDQRWKDVPAGLASQFYRQRRTDKLVPTYFSVTPDYSSLQRLQANQQYFDGYEYNTATPRAIAEYLLKLRADVVNNTGRDSQVAWWLFNTMLLTQRQYSAQSIPGTVYVGAKNGFDFGLVAEVTVIFDSFDNRIPQSIVVIFTRQSDLSAGNIQRPGQRSGVLNQFLMDLSPRIVNILYPNNVEPIVAQSPNLAFVGFGSTDTFIDCWNPYFASGFDDQLVDALRICWNSLSLPSFYGTGSPLAMALILRGLNNADTRLTFIYTSPFGRKYSYQSAHFSQDATGIYWLHTPDESGFWRVDIYQNLQHIYSQTLYIN